MENSRICAAATAVTFALAIGASSQAATERHSPDVGRVEISTVPFDEKLDLRSATYTPSGKILVAYARSKADDPRLVSLAVMDDDGRNMRPFFSQAIPSRPKDNGLRFMVFPDNRRIFLGDFVVECAQSIDRCDRPALIPVDYPREIADGDIVAHRWSEMIVAPDNRHIAWTSLLSNFSAVVFTGTLQREGARYVIDSPAIVSTVEPFTRDPNHPDGVVPAPVRGGEVKQFVRGGTAISLVGAIGRDIPDSVVQQLDNGALEAITDTPGYTETTIFSPDERLGMTMTTRFSPETDPAVLGLVPRPYPAALNMGLSMFAYTHSVTGVRGTRPGNIGPALIDIRASGTTDGYLGTNLSADRDWVFRSPMSWHPGNQKALWVEGRKGSEEVRIRMVSLPDYKPGKAVPAARTPDDMAYASRDLSIIPGLAAKSRDVDVKVYGRVSGYITYRRTPTSIEKGYTDFSDDGRNSWSGRETLKLDPRGNSTYEAKVRLDGAKPGIMDLKLTFGPLGGQPGGAAPAAIVFSPDAQGKALSYGYAEYAGKRLDVSALVP